MKTTLEIPDALLRQVKARAALSGTSMRDFFVQAMEDRLATEQKKRGNPHGWRAVFGRAPRGSVGQIQSLIDEEFERIRPEDWR